jgi:hypothetical protein
LVSLLLLWIWIDILFLSSTKLLGPNLSSPQASSCKPTHFIIG